MGYAKLINEARGHWAFIAATHPKEQLPDHVRSTVIHLRRFAEQAEGEGNIAAAESLRGTADAFEGGSIK
jgi:hypothetical protein